MSYINDALRKASGKGTAATNGSAASSLPVPKRRAVPKRRLAVGAAFALVCPDSRRPAPCRLRSAATVPMKQGTPRRQLRAIPHRFSPLSAGCEGRDFGNTDSAGAAPVNRKRKKRYSRGKGCGDDSSRRKPIPSALPAGGQRHSASRRFGIGEALAAQRRGMSGAEASMSGSWRSIPSMSGR